MITLLHSLITIKDHKVDTNDVFLAVLELGLVTIKYHISDMLAAILFSDRATLNLMTTINLFSSGQVATNF